MRGILYSLIGLILLLSNIFIIGCASSLQFDGVYQSEKEGDYWHYARFYKDHTVITVSSTGKPKEIFHWFKKENIINKNLSNGLYSINNSRLVFSSTDTYGTVDYEGMIQEDTLILNWYSHINFHRGNGKYNFIKLFEN